MAATLPAMPNPTTSEVTRRPSAALGVLLRPIVTLSEVDLAGFRDMLIEAAIGVLRSRLPRKANDAGVRSGT
jgi:hypothetical protein